MPEITEMGFSPFSVQYQLSCNGPEKERAPVNTVPKIHIAWIVMTETNAEISITAASFFGCGFYILFPRNSHGPMGSFLRAKTADGLRDIRKAHSLWSAPFLLKSCPVVAEKQWETFPERTTK